MSRNSWSKSRLFVELTTQQLHQVHTKRGPTENSVHFPAAPLLGMRKDLSALWHLFDNAIPKMLSGANAFEISDIREERNREPGPNKARNMTM